MTPWLEVVVAGLTIITLTLALIGVGVRLVLLPWLREHLVAPVKETNHQVTVNGHVSKDPTLLDKVDELQREVARHREDISIAARMFEGHIDRSGREWGRLWTAIHHLENKKDKP